MSLPPGMIPQNLADMQPDQAQRMIHALIKMQAIMKARMEQKMAQEQAMRSMVEEALLRERMMGKESMNKEESRIKLAYSSVNQDKLIGGLLGALSGGFVGRGLGGGAGAVAGHLGTPEDETQSELVDRRAGTGRLIGTLLGGLGGAYGGSRFMGEVAKNKMKDYKHEQGITGHVVDIPKKHVQSRPVLDKLSSRTPLWSDTDIKKAASFSDLLEEGRTKSAAMGNMMAPGGMGVGASKSLVNPMMSSAKNMMPSMKPPKMPKMPSTESRMRSMMSGMNTQSMTPMPS